MESFGSWSVLTTNFLLILYIALNGVTLAALLHLANAKWRYKVRFLAVSLAALLPVAFGLLIILLVNGDNTFLWMGQPHDPEHHLPGWHNYSFLVTRQIVGFLIIAGLYGLFIKYQHAATIDSSYEAQRRFRNVALLIPFGYVLYATMVGWDFEMTQIPSWHSASYGAYHFVSNFHFFLAFFAIFLFFVKRSGKLKEEVPDYILNFLAQMMLAFTILWTYLYFTQYLVMWYGRLPEEIVRFRNMMDNGLSGVWWTFLAMKFVIPFTSLIFARTRNTPTWTLAIACSIVIGTWLERYTWISGSTAPEHYHIPMTGPLDIVATLLIAAVAIFMMRWSLHRFGLVKSA
ncbi:MAG: hypothetical protein OEZ43_00600 [Gammaproteobacteria bacterium]|nr:hypothetical protein [Gammaproteobacteria bacterium]